MFHFQISHFQIQNFKYGQTFKSGQGFFDTGDAQPFFESPPTCWTTIQLSRLTPLENKAKLNGIFNIFWSHCVCVLCLQAAPSLQLPLRSTPFNCHVKDFVLYSFFIIPLLGLPSFFFPSVLPSMTATITEEDHPRAWPSQALCLRLIVDMISLSSSLHQLCYILYRT
mgnify:CR=1 FL=1